MSAAYRRTSLPTEGLFGQIAEATADQVGVVRDAYGRGEQIAHDMVVACAGQFGLEFARDEALNSYITLPGRDRSLPRLLIGSHLDSVPQGGNYDGLAGVLAGLECLRQLQSAAEPLPRDVVLVAIRAEENCWFGAQHVGSRAALGRLSLASLDGAKRSDTGLTLRQHMIAAGVEIAPIENGEPLVDRSSIGWFLECHIEQGPVLEQQGLSLGVVTGIRGNHRCNHVECVGAYGHSGAEPRSLRRDAVFAAAEMIWKVDRLWAETAAQGEDLVVTFGRFFTNPKIHGLTVIPGEVTFSVDVRSHSAITLQRIWAEIRRLCDEIELERHVSFHFGDETSEDPAPMDPTIREALLAACTDLGLPGFELPSGGGHDAGDFAAAGIPTGMIFIRNTHGSHNPDEHMEMHDYEDAVNVLTRAVQQLMLTANDQ